MEDKHTNKEKFQKEMKGLKRGNPPLRNKRPNVEEIMAEYLKEIRKAEKIKDQAMFRLRKRLKELERNVE